MRQEVDTFDTVSRTLAPRRAEGTLVLDGLGRVRSANPAAQHMLGWSGDDVVGRRLHEVVHGLDNTSNATDCSTCNGILSSAPVHERRDMFTRKDRTVFPVTYSCTVTRDNGHEELVLSFREIPDRRRAGQATRVLGSISLALREAEDLESALCTVLRVTCGFTGWAFGQAWLPIAEEDTLVCSPAWYCSVSGLDGLRAASERMRLPQGMDLPGRAWRSREPVWSRDISAETDGPRRLIIEEAGLRSGLAVPVLAGEEVVAVLEFLQVDDAEPDEQLITIVSEVTAYLGLVIQRKREDEEFRETAARYSAAVDTAFDAITTVTADGVIQSFNRGAERIFGFTADEVVGQPLSILMPAQFRELRASDLKRYLRSAESHVTGQTLELTGVRRDGTEFPLELSITEVRREHGSLFTCIVREISRRKRIEQALGVQFSMLRKQVQFLDLARDAILARDVDTDTILFWNQGAEEMFGWLKGEALGKATHELLHVELPQPLSEIEAKLLEEEYWEGETVCMKRDGARLVLSSRWVLQRDEKGRPTAVLETHNDITERKRVEAERAALLVAEREHSRRLRELATLKADFTAMVAHELSNPLAAIRSLTHLLGMGPADQEEHARIVTAIQREVDALSALVTDVQGSASFEREGFAVQLQRVPARPLLDNAIAFARTLAGDHPVIPKIDAGEEIVWADANRIGQVLRNLLSNAAKYSPEGAPIELRAAVEDGHLRIEVADSGYGIRPGDLNVIFEKFGRGRDQSGKKIPGVGLGLYLSRGIVRAHGSDLRVDTKPGTGSVFGFELEIAA
ncbi:MAG: PAS domain S-box protein [Chloroflexota bacterium]|nr:PAS domain S-box protein [Chloroflexota bacterium]